jgi:hypothetical protein
VQVPETGLPQQNAADLHVLRILDENVARTFHGEVRDIFVHRARFPKFVPIRLAAALDCAFAGDAEMIHVAGVEQRRNPDLKMSLDARHQFGIIGDVRRTLQHRALVKMQIDAGLEKIAPDKKFPCGISSVPPPFAASWSIAFWMATVLSVVPSPTAPAA